MALQSTIIDEVKCHIQWLENIIKQNSFGEVNWNAFITDMVALIWKSKVNTHPVEGGLPWTLLYFIQVEQSLCSYSKVCAVSITASSLHELLMQLWDRLSDGLQFPKQCQPRATFKMTCPCYWIWRREKNETEVFLTACIFSDKYITITENVCWHTECILQVILCSVCCRALEYDVKIIAYIIVKQNSLKIVNTKNLTFV